MSHHSPTDLWIRAADDVDLAMVGLCAGPTLDIGCGPGRMTAALGAAGHLALGIDVVDAAVSLTRQRGASALRRDVFQRLPGEGRWHCALLADGNIGIGGDPVALLQRVRTLLAPGGRVVVEVDPLGVDDVARTARAAGFPTQDIHRLGDRWAAVLSEVPSW